jgi:hypothetical protein
MYKSEIIADSLSPQGDRLTTFIVQFPRIVLSEFSKHRMFSFSSASSRAIPFTKMVKMVKENPFIPIAWQQNHKGMQGTDYIPYNKKFYWNDISIMLEKQFYKMFDNSDMTLKEVNVIKSLMDDSVWSLFKEEDGFTLSEWWLKTRDLVIAASLISFAMGATKQLCNRLLEPFMWHKVIITSGKEGLENFFNLRCPNYLGPGPGFHTNYKSKKDYLKDWDMHLNIKGEKIEREPNIIDWLKINDSQADIHIQAIAEMMWDCYSESKPKQLEAEEWHIPFINKINESKAVDGWWNFTGNEQAKSHEDAFKKVSIKIATAKCSNIYYDDFNGEDSYEFEIKLYNKLIEKKEFSSFEHCAKAMSDEEYESYFSGELSFDYIVDSDREFKGYFHELDLKKDVKYHGWCRNFKGFISHRHQLNI